MLTPRAAPLVWPFPTILLDECVQPGPSREARGSPAQTCPGFSPHSSFPSPEPCPWHTVSQWTSHVPFVVFPALRGPRISRKDALHPPARLCAEVASAAGQLARTAC